MRVLIVEDDRKAAQLLGRGLREEGFQVALVHAAEEVDAQLKNFNPDVLVLDWMLPGQDGLSLCRQLRANQHPARILMLTARDALADRVAGLNGGADDYLTKPFAFDELLARVRALLRRPEAAQPAVLRCGDLALDPMKRSVERAGYALELTPKEYAILEVLMQRPGQLMPRSQLIERIWESDLVAIDNLIDVHISKLRRKLNLPGLLPLLHTVRGQGFRLDADGNG
jgi:DNA-binding response OmpR family regulator